jgi:hypothetical protein
VAKAGQAPQPWEKESFQDCFHIYQQYALSAHYSSLFEVISAPVHMRQRERLWRKTTENPSRFGPTHWLHLTEPQVLHGGIKDAGMGD